ncbi:MAG: PQQ-dependent sugar dehydrogenase [Planctomycetota bacterium]
MTVLPRLCLAFLATVTTSGVALSHEEERMTPLTTELVQTGFTSPIFVTAAPGDYERLFVVEQTGRIKIIKNGQTLATPFINLSTRIRNGSERGLLGLAFHPNYESNGFFFVNYTRSGDGDTVIARYQVTADPEVADFNSEQILLTVDQPFSNHNAGMLAFSPVDGYLYIGMGDGGSGNDPGNRAQTTSELLGKMLRIDVDGGPPYGIPPSNPFVGPGDPLDEIWTIGLRNPWRYSFDSQTGDLWIADVGQNVREEINFQAASSPGGENYGWRCMEGFRCTGLSGCTCNDVALTLPIRDYDHSGGNCSVTGGYVYRGCNIPDLDGTYFYADYCTGRIWSLKYVNGQESDFQERTSELDPPSGTINNVSSFGQDNFGEVYIVDIDGDIFRIVPQTPTYSDCNENGVDDLCDIQLGVSPDANSDNIPDECQLDLAQTPLIRGQNTILTVTLAQPGENVTFLATGSGTGNGPCFFGMFCLDLLPPVVVLGTITADGSGTATFTVPVPANAPLISISSQAIAIRGPAGVDSVKSNAVTDTIQ